MDKHIKRGLIKTIISEKKRRQHKKKLNILSKEDYSPQFFSPTTLIRARDRQAEQKAKDIAKKAQKVAKKLKLAANKA